MSAKNYPQGWHVKENYLIREFEFANFVEAFAFMTQIAHIAEAMNHHPEWSNIYNRVAIRLTTHDEGGISDKDIELANKINAVFSNS
jgi:4a-hydroxytetrahydrobiopterin dehydratase